MTDKFESDHELQALAALMAVMERLRLSYRPDEPHVEQTENRIAKWFFDKYGPLAGKSDAHVQFLQSLKNSSEISEEK